MNNYHQRSYSEKEGQNITFAGQFNWVKRKKCCHLCIWVVQLRVRRARVARWWTNISTKSYISVNWTLQTINEKLLPFFWHLKIVWKIGTNKMTSPAYNATTLRHLKWTSNGKMQSWIVAIVILSWPRLWFGYPYQHSNVFQTHGLAARNQTLRTCAEK